MDYKEQTVSEIGLDLAKLCSCHAENAEELENFTVRIASMVALSAITAAIGISYIKYDEKISLEKGKKLLIKQIQNTMLIDSEDFSNITSESLAELVKDKSIPDELLEAAKREIYERELKV